MPRQKTNTAASAVVADDGLVTIEAPKDEVSFKPLALNISDLVKDVRGRYGKKEKDGIAKNVAVGKDIILSDSDDDYILSKELDYWKPLTGIKGVPFGRIVQIAGKPDSGKSTTAMLFMKAAQQQGHLVILWDAEKKFSTRRYEQSMGGDAATLAITRSKLITEGAKQVAFIVSEAKKQNPDIKIFIVWDSVGATLNSTEDTDDEEEDYSKQPGVTAKEVAWAIRKFNKLIERYKNPKTGQETIAVLCVNQVYANIGSVGDKEKGGQEIEFLSSIILRLARKKDLTRTRSGQKMKYGIVTRAKVKKNHLFDGEECIAELDLVVSADGIKLAEEVKARATDITGWDDEEVD